MSPLKATWTDGETVYARDHNDIARAVNLNSDAAVNLKLLLDGVANRPNATVAQALTAIRALGVTDAAAVNALIAAAIQELQNSGNLGAGLGDLTQSVLDAFGGKPNSTVADLLAYIAGVDGNLATTGTNAFAALTAINEFLKAVAGNPDPSAITIAGGGMVGLAVAAWNDLLAQVAVGGGGAEPVAQQLIDIIGGKPQGGGSIADVAATFSALGQALMGAVGIEEAAVNALITAALADLDLSSAGLDEAAVLALLEEKLTEFGPMIVMAVQSQMTAMPDRIRLNVNDASPGAKVVIEALNLTATAGKPNPVSMDIEVPGGALSVNGIRVATTKDVELFNGLIENLYNAITGGVPQINGATGQPIAPAIVVGNYLLGLATGIATIETNVNAFGDNVLLLSATKAENSDLVALQAAVAALGSGSGGAGLTGEQAQLIVKTAADLNALITGITGIYETSPNPDGVVNVIRRLNKDAETGAKLATAFLAGFLGKPVNQLGSTEQEAMQAIVDWCINFRRTVEGQGSNITGILTDLGTANNNIEGIAEVVIPLRETVDSHGERITTLEGAALGGEGVSQTVVDSLVARLDALESENAKLKAQVLVLADNANTAAAEVAEALGKKADRSALSATDLRVQSIGDANGFLQNNLVSLSEDVKDKADKTELASYAKLDDGNQEFTAGLIKVGGVQFTMSDEVLVPLDFPDYGKRLAVIPKDTQDLDDAGIVVIHTDLADLASGVVTSAQLSQAISTVQAPIEDLVRRTQNLTDDGTLSTLHVLGDGFRDENDNPTHPSLYEGLQFLIDVLYSVADGSGAFNTGSTIVTMFEALTAAFSASGGGKDLGITVLQTANGPVLKTDAGIIQTADQTAHGSREIIRIINVLNGVLNTVSGKVDTLMGRPPGRSFTEAEWQPCSIIFNGAAAGGIDATEIDGVVHLRGGLSTNAFRTAITTGGFLAVGKIPDGMTRPEVATLLPVWAILTGSTYRIAVIRVGTDGVISVTGPTGAIDGFDVTGVSFPAGGIAARGMGEEDLSLLDAGGDGEPDSIDDLEERLQLFMDAIDGPNATPEKMQETFWLINDVLSRLVEGANIQISRSAVPELVAVEGAPRQVFAQGIDPETPVPKSYLMGLVIGLTTTKLNKLISLDLIPSFKQGSSIMMKPIDVAAAMEAAGMYSEAEETQYAQAAEIVIED
jgi:hypothetical protein